MTCPGSTSKRWLVHCQLRGATVLTPTPTSEMFVRACVRACVSVGDETKPIQDLHCNVFFYLIVLVNQKKCLHTCLIYVNIQCFVWKFLIY